MREITTHKVNGCNEAITIKTDDALTISGAPTKYWLRFPLPYVPIDPLHASVRDVIYDVKFQDGPINEVGTNGLTHEALLAIVADRLHCFQAGPYACNENMRALCLVVEAMEVLKERTTGRMNCGVEGTHAV